jgi:hypothetical protein
MDPDVIDIITNSPASKGLPKLKKSDFMESDSAASASGMFRHPHTGEEYQTFEDLKDSFNSKERASGGKNLAGSGKGFDASSVQSENYTSHALNRSGQYAENWPNGVAKALGISTTNEKGEAYTDKIIEKEIDTAFGQYKKTGKLPTRRTRGEHLLDAAKNKSLFAENKDGWNMFQDGGVWLANHPDHGTIDASFLGDSIFGSQDAAGGISNLLASDLGNGLTKVKGFEDPTSDVLANIKFLEQQE